MTAADFVPATYWNLADHATLTHECCHAQVAVWFPGIHIVEVRIDRPGDHVGGHVNILVDRGRSYEALCVMIAGEIGTGGTIGWPPRPDKYGDEKNAAMLVARLGLDEQGWDDAHALVREVLAQPTVRAFGRELAYRLRLEGALPGDEVEAIYEWCQ